ncbi:hypothetical protein [Blastococcus sp. LR1]|uniref:hypothetical protein n=1 Tax=Blastococcus sp. LR1 TaxID=2877000 RepID=UPI001CCE9DFC|nr:hypothetical protein [Blastococcus sp. LR1]MCA0145990.1 hypothetical protein [Blastococcus sp. LR1]
MTAPGEGYVERGGSWRPAWVAGGFAALCVVLELVLPGPDLPLFAWAALAVVVVISTSGSLAGRRLFTVRVEGAGDGSTLSVGRERVALTEVDADHLRALESGVDAGAPVLGGAWSIPKGSTGLPLKLADGRTVLVPTRDPDALRAALLTAKGTLEP